MQIERVDPDVVRIRFDPQKLQALLGERNMILALEIIEEFVFVESRFDVFGHYESQAREFRDGDWVSAVFENA